MQILHPVYSPEGNIIASSPRWRRGGQLRRPRPLEHFVQADSERDRGDDPRQDAAQKEHPTVRAGAVVLDAEGDRVDQRERVERDARHRHVQLGPQRADAHELMLGGDRSVGLRGRQDDTVEGEAVRDGLEYGDTVHHGTRRR